MPLTENWEKTHLMCVPNGEVKLTNSVPLQGVVGIDLGNPAFRQSLEFLSVGMEHEGHVLAGRDHLSGRTHQIVRSDQGRLAVRAVENPQRVALCHRKFFEKCIENTVRHVHAEGHRVAQIRGEIAVRVRIGTRISGDAAWVVKFTNKVVNVSHQRLRTHDNILAHNGLAENRQQQNQHSGNIVSLHFFEFCNL